MQLFLLVLNMTGNILDIQKDLGTTSELMGMGSLNIIDKRDLSFEEDINRTRNKIKCQRHPPEETQTEG